MRIPAWMLFLGTLALIGVASGIALVVVSLNNRHVLVREDYYRDGLRLDEYRAREAAFDSLRVSLALRSEGGALVLEAKGGSAEARERLEQFVPTVELRRPDDPSADRDVPMTLASGGPPVWVAHAAPLRAGRWNVRAVFADAEGKAVMERSFVFNAF